MLFFYLRVPLRAAVVLGKERFSEGKISPLIGKRSLTLNIIFQGTKTLNMTKPLSFSAFVMQLFDVGGASATKKSKNLDRHCRNIRTLASNNPTVYKAQAI